MANNAGTFIGGAALATVFGVTYYLNNQIILPIKEDLEKTIQAVYEIKKKTDIIDVNNKNIAEIASITKKHSLIINQLISSQTKLISSLMETIIDMQKKLYTLGIPTKLIPKQYLPMLKKNQPRNGHVKKTVISELDDL